MLKKGGPVSIISSEMAKVSKDHYPSIITELFKPRGKQNNNLLNNAEFTIPVIKTVYHGSEIISFLGPEI